MMMMMMIVIYVRESSLKGNTLDLLKGTSTTAKGMGWSRIP
jgi:hypothetical protein